MKQTNTVNNGHVKRTPKIFFWRYYLYILLLAIVVLVTILIINNFTD